MILTGWSNRHRGDGPARDDGQDLAARLHTISERASIEFGLGHFNDRVKASLTEWVSQMRRFEEGKLSRRSYKRSIPEMRTAVEAMEREFIARTGELAPARPVSSPCFNDGAGDYASPAVEQQMRVPANLLAVAPFLFTPAPTASAPVEEEEQPQQREGEEAEEEVAIARMRSVVRMRDGLRNSTRALGRSRKRAQTIPGGAAAAATAAAAGRRASVVSSMGSGGVYDDSESELLAMNVLGLQV